MLDAVALGELLIDFTCTGENGGYPLLQAHPGGAPANFLAAMTKYGGKTAFIGKVGADTFGELLTNTLLDAGIGTQGLVRDKNVFTTLAFVTLDKNGDREFSFARKPGADTCLTEGEVYPALIDEAKVFHFGTLSLTDEPAKTATQKAIGYARKKGKLISCDPNLRLPLWDDPERAAEAMRYALSVSDIVKISDDEVEFLFSLSPEEGAKEIMTKYETKLVYVTCGAKGCYFRNKNASGFVSAPANIRVLDTTGAGDIFGGSAMIKLLGTGKAPEELTEEELRRIVSFACTAASLSTEKSGGIFSVPDETTVSEYLRARK